MHDLDPHRLPTTVSPTRYALELAPDLASATFSGTASIAVDVHEPVGAVVLNALELDIDEAWLELADGTRLDATATIDEKAERAELALAATAPAGPATLHLAFRGVLNDKLNGFYRSRFTDADGVEQLIATTQMEATYARKAFPCWDEPAAKATFSVALVVPDGLAALSNGAEVDREPLGDGRVRVRFADTMRMSTYLVAFVVGPFEATEPRDVDGTPVRVAAPRGKTHLAGYALDVAEACLRYFTDYYAIPYPGGKLDLVAVPDFAFGAMENTGCVTFREVLLLTDPARATHTEMLSLTDVVNHEIAHMWFGNLVTMKWWNGIWLNEAFATFMEMKATEAFRPDWNRWVEFGLSRSAALQTDSLDSTRPIEFKVSSPDEAEGMFDVLTYEKGGGVLRMLEQYLGEDRFRDGVRRYLAANAYGNTETTDLWDSIEQAVAGAGANEPVRRIMDSWIFQGGHPIVEAELSDDGRSLELGQERFRLSAAADPDAEGEAAGLGEVWAVPVVLKVGGPGGEREQRVLLDTMHETADLGEPAEWVVANAGGHGFYRVRYGPRARAALVAHGIGNLDVLERYNLLDDAHAAVVAGASPATDVLELARAYADETDPAVWKLLAGVLGELDRIVPDRARDALATVVRGLAGTALRRVGFDAGDGDDDRRRELRATLLRLAAIVGRDEQAIAEAQRLRQAEIDEPGSVDPSLMAAATAVVADTGGAEAFEVGLARHRAATTPQEEVRELYALGRTHDRASMDRLLEMSLTELRSQNAPYLLRVALENRTEGPRVWEFIRRNWDRVNDRFPSNSIVRMLEGIESLVEETIANDVATFFAEHEVPQGAHTLSQHLERQRAGVALRQREGEPLADALLR